MLVDTGATITILRTDFIQSLPKDVSEQLENVNSFLITATGDRTPFAGKCSVCFQIGTQLIDHEVWFADIQNEGIIGFDFMSKHRCNVSLKDFELTVDGKSTIPLQSSVVSSNCCRVMIAENTTIPANTETFISGIPSACLETSKSVIIEPTSQFIKNNGLLLAKSLSPGNTKHIPLRILNATDQIISLKKGYTAAVCESIENIEETIAISSCSVTKNESEKQLPSHLEKLFNLSCQELTNIQQKHLRELLCNFGDVFSKSPTDIGRTKLVKHKIDTGNSKPIRQSPRRIPFAKREEVKNEIEEMKKKRILP